MCLRILVVDDHALVRAGFVSLIRGRPGVEVVGEASNGRDGMRLIDELEPDLVLLDVGLPDISGIEITRRLRQERALTKVLILTLYDDDDLAREAFSAGAVGFLLKSASQAELFGAIQVVRCGGLYMDPRLISAWTQPTLPDASLVVDDATELTQRQVQVLQLVAQGYSNPEIARRLFISVRTVEYHRRRIVDRLHLHSRPDLVQFAVEHGLLS